LTTFIYLIQELISVKSLIFTI